MKLKTALKFLVLVLSVSSLAFSFTSHNSRKKRGKVFIDGLKGEYRIFTFKGTLAHFKERTQGLRLIFESEDSLFFTHHNKFYFVFGKENPTVVEFAVEGSSSRDSFDIKENDFHLLMSGGTLHLETGDFEVRSSGGQIDFRER